MVRNDSNPARTAVCTIVAKNYLAHARVLMETIQRHDPQALRIVFLVDRVDGCFDPSQEPFEVICSEDLNIPNSRWFHFKYTVLELSTAIKPYALEFALERFGLDKIIYLDPDIKTYAPLEGIWRQLDHSQMVLTPHVTQPLNDSYRPSELDLLRAGAYNLGFIALRRTPEMRAFLKWWQARLYEYCVVDLPRGLFVDQKWIDLVPGAFSGVFINREPGYNVAYWNVGHRPVERSGEEYTVQGSPLYFFHFSGLDVGGPEGLSRHQDRHRTSELGPAQTLVEDYLKDLRRKGYDTCSRWPYAYGTFANGVAIPDATRSVHRESDTVVDSIADPFSVEAYDAFTEVWNQPAEGPRGKAEGVTRLGYKVYRSDEDLRDAAPDVFGRDRRRFLHWLLEEGPKRHGLGGAFLTPVWEAARAADRHARAGGDAPTDPVRERPQVITRFARTIYESRPDLQVIFPDPYGVDAPRFLIWILSYGKQECRLEGQYLERVRQGFEEILAAQESWSTRLRYRLLLRAMTASFKARAVGAKLLRRRGNNGEPAAVRGKRKRPVPAASVVAPGFNLVGYLKAETGVGEGTRLFAKAAREAGVAVSLRGIQGGPQRMGDPGLGAEDREFPHPVNVYHVNADVTPQEIQALGASFPQDRYRVGYWFWELEEFPNRWLSSFEYLDEVWAGSSFCQDSFARKSPVPVVRMPYAIHVDESRLPPPSAFDLPRGKFVFLALFDMLSVFERKNPLAAVRAFGRAFGDADDCHLIVKVNHGEHRPDHMQRLREAAAAVRNVTLIDRTLARDEVYGLIQACDCMVSLHRSEGFGFPMAEAMFLGKPVIATGYSGNLDFTKPDNSFLVTFRMVPVGPGNEPYHHQATWADPDVDDAARQMREVFHNAERRRAVSARGQAFVREEFSMPKIGARIRERLVRIGEEGARRAR